MSDTEEPYAKIELRTEDGNDVYVETPWAVSVGPNRYRIDNLPFYAYRVSWGDIVEAEVQADGFPLFVRVVEKSGNRTVRVILDPPADESQESKASVEKLIEMGCSLEWANPKLVCANVPPKVDLDEVARYLTSTGQNWEYADPTWEDRFGEEALAADATTEAQTHLSEFLPVSDEREPPAPRTIIEAYRRYYEQVKYPRCDPKQDADMLLFQYGVHDSGDGPYFDVDFTRQFMVRLDADEHQIEQLHVTLYFDPGIAFDTEAFNLWSAECSNADDFVRRVVESAGFRLAERERPLRWEVRHEVV